MKYIKEFNHLAFFIFLYIVFTMSAIKSCKEVDKPFILEKDYLEIYTNTNIYYVNVNRLEVSNENDNKVQHFKTFRELSVYVSELTAKEANEVEVDVPEEYRAMSLNTPIEGYYNNKTHILTINFKHNYEKR